jgi:hypothetical protein
MSAPFNSCEDGEEEDIGALVAYLSLALEAGICVGRLYFVLESIVDPETFELTETLQLITSCGSGNYAAMFATFLGGGEDGIPEDNCPENDLRFSAPEESMCRFWPGTAPSYLHLVPTP